MSELDTFYNHVIIKMLNKHEASNELVIVKYKITIFLLFDSAKITV